MLARTFEAREIKHVRSDVLALPVERWRDVVRSEYRARVFGCPHGAEGVEVARGAPGDVVQLSRWVRSTLSAAKKAAPVLISYSGKRRAVGRRPAGTWRPRAPLLYERGYPVGLLIVGVLRGDLVGVRGVPWLVSIQKDLVLSMKRFGIEYQKIWY